MTKLAWTLSHYSHVYVTYPVSALGRQAPFCATSPHCVRSHTLESEESLSGQCPRGSLSYCHGDIISDTMLRCCVKIVDVTLFHWSREILANHSTGHFICLVGFGIKSSVWSGKQKKFELLTRADTYIAVQIPSVPWTDQPSRSPYSLPTLAGLARDWLRLFCPAVYQVVSTDCLLKSMLDPKWEYWSPRLPHSKSVYVWQCVLNVFYITVLYICEAVPYIYCCCICLFSIEQMTFQLFHIG